MHIVKSKNEKGLIKHVYFIDYAWQTTMDSYNSYYKNHCECAQRDR